MLPNAGLWAALCEYAGEDIVDTGLAVGTADTTGDSDGIVDAVVIAGMAGTEPEAACVLSGLRCRAADPDRDLDPEPEPDPDALAEVGIVCASPGSLGSG